jgi:uncharacterized membrane protein (UPF0127 family)
MSFHHLIRAAAFGAFVALAGCAQADTQTPAAPASAQADGVHRETVVVETSRGPVTFYAEIADDDAERARGLMFRREMARDHGMLFEFEAARPQSFWMRNTHLSLDRIFIGADGRIVNIAENATPYSDAPIPSAGPAIGVLEINAGLSRELGIAAGDRVRHPFLPSN